MAERETYYYNFKYVDGTTEEFEQKTTELEAMFINPGRERIKVGDTLINLDNVITVTVETKTQRDEGRRETVENLKDFRF